MTSEALPQTEQRSFLRGNVLAFSFVSLLQDTASEMIYPLLPTFLTGVLLAPVAVVGLIEGLAESLSTLIKVASGWLSDRSGRRKVWASGGYLLSGLAKPFFAIATAWPQVLAVRTLDRLGKGLRGAPRDALMALDVPADQRGQAFGFHRAMDTLGAVIGPILAALLLQATQGNMRAVFAWAILPGLLSAAVAIIFVRERPAPRIGADLAGFRNLRGLSRLTLAPLDRRFKRFLLVLVLFTLANSSDAFLLLRARTAGLPLTLVPLLWLVFNSVYALGAGPAGWLSDRLPRKRVLIAGFTLYALVYLGFALVSAAWQVWLLFACYGLYYAMTESVSRALTADLTPPELRGTAFGLYYTATGLALFPASLIAGVLWDAAGPWAPFAFGAGWSALATLLLALWV